MKITVKYIPSEVPLGTEDGQQYLVYPVLPDDDEYGQHGGQA